MGDRARLAASAAFYLLALAAQMSGWTSAPIAVVLAAIATILLLVPCYHHARQWHLRRQQMGARMGTPQIILLIGIAGAWLFISVVLGAGAWLVLNQKPAAVISSSVPATSAAIGQTATAQPEGPITWLAGLTMEGGPSVGTHVFSLRFKGVNTSQQEIRIKEANIISAINGTKIGLEIVAQNEIVPLNQIELVPAGAPIELVAKFGPPDPKLPGKIMGLEAKQFLETWKQFSLNVEDSVRHYRLLYNEGSLAPFFPGMVGPHITKKMGTND